MNNRELAAAYLLDELDASGRADVEKRLETDAALRAEVDATRSVLATLEDLPADAWPAEETPAAGTAPRKRAPRRWTLRPALAVAALILVGGLGALVGILAGGGDGGGSNPPPASVLRPLGAAVSGESATVAMPAPGEMVLRAKGLPPSAPGQYYELWLMSDARRTVPVASFRIGADGAALVRVPLPAEPGAFRYFDVSRQTVAGGTEHSSNSVLRGATS